MLEAAIAGARWLEAGGAAVLFGGALLLWMAAVPADAAPWTRTLVLTAAAACGLGSLLALGLQTVGMAGSWREGLSRAALGGVVSETGFGRSVAVRAVATAGAALAARRADGIAGRAAVAGLGGAALASLAWSGHGAADEGLRGAVHLGGDLLHLLSAGAWLGALVVLGLLARSARDRPEHARALSAALSGFSRVGGAVVAALLLSGLANGWFLVGPDRWRELAGSAWGRLLLAKLALFVAMLALAALNRWRLAPRLDAAAGAHGGAALSSLRRSVAWEAALGLAVLAAVAVMGGLAPPAAQA